MPLYGVFFPGEVMDQEYDKKYLLLNEIQKATNKKILKTPFLYRLDLKNTASFHNYIDGKENFLIIVKTSKDSIFGAFSTSKFEQKYNEPAETKAFIFTFNSDLPDPITTFNINYSKEKAKSLQWDEYFLIVGNSEIRWRSG